MSSVGDPSSEERQILLEPDAGAGGAATNAKASDVTCSRKQQGSGKTPGREIIIIDSDDDDDDDNESAKATTTAAAKPPLSSRRSTLQQRQQGTDDMEMPPPPAAPPAAAAISTKELATNNKPPNSRTMTSLKKKIRKDVKEPSSSSAAAATAPIIRDGKAKESAIEFDSDSNDDVDYKDSGKQQPPPPPRATATATAAAAALPTLQLLLAADTVTLSKKLVPPRSSSFAPSLCFADFAIGSRVSFHKPAKSKGKRKPLRGKVIEKKAGTATAAGGGGPRILVQYENGTKDWVESVDFKYVSLIAPPPPPLLPSNSGDINHCDDNNDKNEEIAPAPTDNKDARSSTLSIVVTPPAPLNNKPSSKGQYHKKNCRSSLPPSFRDSSSLKAVSKPPPPSSSSSPPVNAKSTTNTNDNVRRRTKAPDRFDPAPAIRKSSTNNKGRRKKNPAIVDAVVDAVVMPPASSRGEASSLPNYNSSTKGLADTTTGDALLLPPVSCNNIAAASVKLSKRNPRKRPRSSNAEATVAKAVPSNNIMEYAIGSRVAVKWDAKTWNRGTISERGKRSIKVDYDDRTTYWVVLGDQEVKLIALPPDSAAAAVVVAEEEQCPLETIAAGDRISVFLDVYGAYFDGVVTGIEEDTGRAEVLYDEFGDDHGYVDLKCDQVKKGKPRGKKAIEKAASVKVGYRVLVFWRTDEEYFSAEVQKIDHKANPIVDRPHYLVYDDGETEWTNLAFRTFLFLGSPKPDKKSKNATTSTPKTSGNINDEDARIPTAVPRPSGNKDARSSASSVISTPAKRPRKNNAGCASPPPPTSRYASPKAGPASSSLNEKANRFEGCKDMPAQELQVAIPANSTNLRKDVPAQALQEAIPSASRNSTIIRRKNADDAVPAFCEESSGAIPASLNTSRLSNAGDALLPASNAKLSETEATGKPPSSSRKRPRNEMETTVDGDEPPMTEDSTSDPSIADYAVGRRVSVYWAGEKKSYDGKVIEKGQRSIEVEYDDGETKWVVLRDQKVTLLPTPDATATVAAESVPVTFADGDRISVLFGGDGIYWPGEVRERTGDNVYVEFDDGKDNGNFDIKRYKFKRGRSASKKDVEIAASVKVGHRVEVFWRLEEEYYPAVVDQIDRKGHPGKPHHLVYDDGEDEWTNLMIRSFNFLDPLELEDLDEEELDKVFSKYHEGADDDSDYDEPSQKQKSHVSPLNLMKVDVGSGVGRRTFEVGKWYYLNTSPGSKCFYKICSFAGQKNATKVLLEKLEPVGSTFIGNEGTDKELGSQYVSLFATEIIAFLANLVEVSEVPQASWSYEAGKHFSYTPLLPPAPLPQLPEGKPATLELFAGVGGMSHGLKEAGFDVRWAVEKDPYAALNLQLSERDATVYQEDVNDFLTRCKEERPGYPSKLEVHHAHFSPPCQGFSLLNRGGKNDDENNDLLDVIMEYVKCFLPLTVTVENVTGILQEKHVHRVKRIMTELMQLGYSVRLAVLDASHFGDPQKRRRVFIVASRTGIMPPMPECTRVGNPRTVKDAIEDLASIATDGGRSCLSSDVFVWNHEEIPGTAAFPLDANKPACTITTQTIARHYDDKLKRNVTVRELARLQSFPDSHRFIGEARRLLRFIGNAVPVRLATAVSKATIKAYER